jgi:hypothetical protein
VGLPFPRLGRPIVGGDERVFAGKDLDRPGAGTQPHLLTHEPMGDRVVRPLEAHVAITVDPQLLPGRWVVWGPW